MEKPTDIAEIFTPGRLIADQWTIERTLGAGGMGVVYLAHDERLDRDVAIKTIHPSRLTRAGVRERFTAEARALARIEHPNVTRIYSIGEIAGVPYFVMEYVPGRTLAELLDEGALERRPLADSVAILKGICEGLSAIHRVGLVHGDLKPGNVLVARTGRVVLTDMGLARALARPDMERGIVWGTAEYIAPELARGTSVPPHLLPRADVYSLAVIAFEVLTDRLPFEGKTPAETMLMHLEDPPPAPSAVKKGLSPAFDGVILRGMEKNPKTRVATAERFAAKLGRALDRAARGTLRFVVVDDDHDHRGLVAEVLARNFPGSVVEAFGDGAAALEAIEQSAPATVIVDLDMPRMNGMELVAAIRGRHETVATPIVVLTGVGGPNDWHALRQMGVDHFFVKPVIASHLVSVVRTLLVRTDPRLPVAR